MNKCKILIMSMAISLASVGAAHALRCSSSVSGHYYNKNGVCTLVPAGYYGTMELDDTNCDIEKSVWGDAICCSHGDGYDAYESITVCPKGWYCAGGYYFEAVCKCPSGTTTSGTGATSVSDCNICDSGYEYNGSACVLTSCPAGQTLDSAGTACTECARGTYKSTTTTAACTGCGTGKTTNGTGSTSSVDCICAAGYGGSSCTICAKGSYKSTTGSAACTGCGTGKTTASTGSTTSSACVCAAGYGGSSCTICPIGTYKSATGPAECTPCPNNGTTDTTGATSEDQCIATTPKLCEFGATMLHVGDYVFNLYPDEVCERPAIHIGLDNGVCCAKLEKGEGVNALHVRYNGEVYHTVN